MLGVEIAETVFEPRVGGYLYDRGVDGSECRWARVLAYEPPDRVVISWDISPQWRLETDLEKTSEVEVRFHPEAPERRGSRSSTATSSATAQAGKRCATTSPPPTAGRSTSGGSPTWLQPRECARESVQRGPPRPMQPTLPTHAPRSAAPGLSAGGCPSAPPASCGSFVRR